MTSDWYRRWRKWVFALYIAIGVVTYGQAATVLSQPNEMLILKNKTCTTPEARLANDELCFSHAEDPIFPASLRATAAAAFWPLWWSWKLQS